MTDPRKLAEAHWSYTEGILRAMRVPANALALCKHLYIEAMVHGYKHAVADGKGK